MVFIAARLAFLVAALDARIIAPKISLSSHELDSLEPKNRSQLTFLDELI
ncbi:MAG: hypothetical protein IPG39_21240 [Bacteroidetes bacterium]|nr:hypothetical protein [Bacteroidota bacterium]